LDDCRNRADHVGTNRRDRRRNSVRKYGSGDFGDFSECVFCRAVFAMHPVVWRQALSFGDRVAASG